MLVREEGKYPVCDIKTENGTVLLRGEAGDDFWSGTIHLDPGAGTGGFLLDLEYQPASGQPEKISIPD
jgi:hypothetical protein